MANNSKVLSAKLPLADVRHIPSNRSELFRQAVAEKLARESGPAWRPKTATGRKLLKLRNQFLAQGGELLDANSIADELRQRRGGFSRKHFARSNNEWNSSILGGACGWNPATPR
jgi:hypothetical protein